MKDVKVVWIEYATQKYHMGGGTFLSEPLIKQQFDFPKNRDKHKMKRRKEKEER